MLGLTLPGTVSRVIDGDTVEIKIERTIRVRLLDCWAPETRTSSAIEKQRGIDSRDHLEREAIGREVELQIPLDADGKFGDAMSFGRVLGRVRRVDDGQDLSVLQVAAGKATKARAE